MTTTIFLARLLGFWMAASGLFMLFRRKDWAKGTAELFKSTALMVLTGLIALAAGIAIIVGYNTWTGWEIVISLFGVFLALQGLARLFFPDLARRFVPDFKGHSAAIAGLCFFGLGVFFFLMGYFFG